MHFIIAYDVTNPSRLQRLYKALCEYALPIQNLKTVESTLSQIRRRRARGTSGLWPSSP